MRQRLGQNFLKDRGAIKKIVESLGLEKDEVVFEIGTGHGELTGELIAKNLNLKIITIEKDSGLVKFLQKKFAEVENLEIIEGDIRKELKTISEKLKTYKIVGNIPYYLTGYLFRLISELQNKPKVCVLTIQKEVAERVSAKPPEMNKLAASVQWWANPEIIQILSKNLFRPEPKVDSAIIKLVLSIKDPSTTKVFTDRQVSSEKYFETVNMLFKQPRKTILNNILETEKYKKEEIIEKLKEIGIKPELRPQNLGAKDIIQIAQGLGS